MKVGLQSFCPIGYILTLIPDDRPRYKRGNRALLAINALNIGLYVFAKVYYTLRNRYRDRKWNAMTEDERTNYLATTKDKGNKRLDFRFAS